MKSMRVMSFNVRNDCDKGNLAWRNRAPKTVALIKDANPHLIGVQEALHHQYLDLIAALPQYASAGVGRDDGLCGGEYAAVFYKKDRFRALKKEHFWLSEHPNRPGRGWDAACIRICTAVTLLDKATGKTFAHFNTHLDHEGERAMLCGARLVGERIRAAALPVVVTGDFNSDEGSPPYNAMLAAGLRDAKYAAEISMSYGTYHEYAPGAALAAQSPIDYIFFSKGAFTASMYKVLVDGEDSCAASDHYPILAEISSMP